VLLARHEPQAALAAFESGLRRWPNNAGGRYLAGLAARDLGDFERSISEMREAMRADSRATDAALVLAYLQLARGNPGDAAEAAQNFIAHRGASRPEGHLILVRALVAQQLYDAARRNVSKMQEAGLERDAVVAQALIEGAASGPAAAAAVVRSSGLDLADPANEAALRSLADALVASGKVDQAIAATDRALAGHDDVASLHTLRGTLLLKAGRDADATQAFERALALGGDQTAAKMGLAELAYRRGDAARAVALYDEAARANPDDQSAAYAAAQITQGSGDRVGAKQRLEEIVRRDPGHAGARNDLAWLLAQQSEDLDRALQLAEMAHRIDPKPDIIDTLGFVRLQRGENDQAAALFEEAVAARPDSQSMRYHLGLALARRGEQQRAQEALRAALEAGPFPEAEAARSELARLEGR
jgi:tetratricopeptide (TPR) repeat protein